MDQSWVGLPNRYPIHILMGVKKFIDFAFENVVGDKRIYCPSKVS